MNRKTIIMSSALAIAFAIAPNLPAAPASNITATEGVTVETGGVALQAVKETPAEAAYGRVVSENATFAMSSPSVRDRAADHPRLFRGEKSDRGFAFHTCDELNPWVQIDLGRLVNVTGLSIENRPGERRTEGLALSISEDAQQWTKVWTAPKWEQIWEVPVMTTQAGAEVPGRPARYLKLETNPAKAGPMLLQRVEIFGK